jgi:hypothetical protein
MASFLRTVASDSRASWNRRFAVKGCFCVDYFRRSRLWIAAD